ncbi:MAG: HAD family hydrolase [Bacteroidota bacterium]
MRQKPERPIRCVIFDVDGTLAQTNDLIFSTFNYVAERFVGKRFSPEQIIAFFGPPEEVAIARLLGEGQLPRLRRAVAEFYEYYYTHLPEMARLYPGIDELLKELKGRNIRLAIFTGKGRRTTLMTLEGLNIAHYFDLLVTGDDVTDHKPSGEGIRQILIKLKCSPEETLMVGDSVSDVKAACEAGVRIASAQWDSYSIEKLREMKVELSFQSVAGLRRWLLSQVDREYSDECRR